MTLEEKVLSTLRGGQQWLTLTGNIVDYEHSEMTVQEIMHVSVPAWPWTKATTVKELAQKIYRIQKCTKFKMLAIKFYRVDFGLGSDYAAIIVGVV